MEKLNRNYIRHTKNILVGFISLLILGACSSVPEEEVEETEVVDETTEVESEEEVEATEKEEEEAKVEEEEERKAEEERIAKEEEEKLALEAKEKEEKERKAKEKAEEERKAKEEEERKAEEERVAKEKEEKERKAEEERVAKEEAERKAKEEEERKAKEEAERKAKEELDVSLGEDAYLAIMRENLSAFVDVEFNKDSKIFILTPNNETLNTEIAMLTQGIGHEDWGILVDGLASMSKSGMDLVGEGYSINLVNPHNEENILLWIMDGVVMYNVIDDL